MSHQILNKNLFAKGFKHVRQSFHFCIFDDIFVDKKVAKN